MKTIFCICLLLLNYLNILCRTSEISEDRNVQNETTTTFLFGDLGSAKCLISESSLIQRIYYSCRDIRYAEAPTGSFRFKATPLVTKFSPRLYDATKFRRDCPGISAQIDFNVEDLDVLDCLYLTIHTPNPQMNASVMVYITGFDLLQGSNREVNPAYFMEEDIVLVSVQYRLGVFGFLNAESIEAPGNAGIYDILNALTWIQKYISLFGGNPKSVTLFGHYKVAGIIQLLTMIQEAEGLFHGVICQSGSIFTQNLLSLSTASLSLSSYIGIQMGCPNVMSRKRLMDCLCRNRNLKDLNGLFREYMETHNGKIGLVNIGGVNSLIPYFPHEMKSRNRIRPLPMIIGIVEHPSTYLLDESFKGNLSIFSSDHPNLIDGIGMNRNEYRAFLLDRIGTEDKRMRKNLKSGIDLSDSSIRYVYVFKFLGHTNFLKKKIGNTLHDVALLDENVYLFPDIEFVSEKDRKVAKMLIKLWTSFAKYGRPKYEYLQDWPAYNTVHEKHLIIDANLTIGDGFREYSSPTFKELTYL